MKVELKGGGFGRIVPRDLKAGDSIVHYGTGWTYTIVNQMNGREGVVYALFYETDNIVPFAADEPLAPGWRRANLKVVEE
jgi:hypothetical protein